jgi:hypothetical protein
LCRAYRQKVAGWRALGAWARQELTGGPGQKPGDHPSCDTGIGLTCSHISLRPICVVAA